MRVQVQKWGNSYALRIPKKLAEDVHVSKGTEMELSVEKGKLVASPVRKKYKLDDLLAKVTKKNVHPETDWGEPIGKEII